MKLVIATANQGKVKEFSAALAHLGLELLTATEVGVKDFPEETGANYKENAAIKALHVAQLSGLPSLADDSGLEVDALNGAPGLYSARYGNLNSDSERTAFLLSNIENIETSKRGAKFVCSLVLVNPDGLSKSFWGEAKGTLLRAASGSDGFGYDPIFYSFDLDKTFSEASKDEKRKVSHRGHALNEFEAWFKTEEAKTFFSSHP